MRLPRPEPAPVAAALVATAAAGFVFGPSLPWLTTRFVGEPYVDHYGTQWFYWFAEATARRGEAPDRAAVFFHPFGKDVYADTGSNVLDGVLAIPFRAALGPVAGYDVFVILGMIAAAVAVGAFAAALTRDKVAAIVAGALFLLSPYGLVELAEGRPTQGLMLLPVAFLAATWRSAAPGWRAPVLAGVLLAACGYQYWFYAFFGGFAALGAGGVALARPEGARGAVLARFAGIAALALALTVPFAGGLATGATPVAGLLDLTDWSLTANPPTTVEGVAVSLYAWQPLRGDVGSYVVDTDGHERFLSRAAAFPLAVVPLLALWLWRPSGVRRGPVIAALVALAVVGLGPVVLIGTWALPNPLYHALIHALPFVRRLWWPGRALAFASVLVAIACAGGLAALRAWPRVQLGAGALAVALAAASAWVDGLAPAASWDATIPAGYRCLASGPPGALLELPFGWTQAHLYYQIAHQRPIFGGMLENNPTFTPAGTRALQEKNTWVVAVNAVASREPASAWTERDRQAMRDLGYAYVVLQKDAFEIAEDPGSMQDNAARVELRRWTRRLEALAGPPVYDDARLAIFAPWGDPSPCDPVAWPKDTVAVGATEVVNVAGARNKDAQRLTRVFAARAVAPPALPAAPGHAPDRE